MDNLWYRNGCYVHYKREVMLDPPPWEQFGTLQWPCHPQVLIEHIMEERYSTWSIVLCTIELPQWVQWCLYITEPRWAHCIFACYNSIVWPSCEHDVNIWMANIGPHYCSTYSSTFGWFHIICALNTCENEGFWQLSALKHFGEYCFALVIIWALNTHKNGIFWQQFVPK